MKRRNFIYSAVSATSVAALSGCTEIVRNQENSNKEKLKNGSFEDNLSGWTIGKDLPKVPGGSDKVSNEVSITEEKSSDGDKSVSFYIEGIADDGTIWVEQIVNLTQYDEFKIDVYSEQKSFNILSEVAFFAGQKSEEGLSEVDFNRDNDVEDHEGWKTYKYDISELEGEKTVAIGMNVVWETGIKRFFDNARLE
jgi:hypothetical protein